MLTNVAAIRYFCRSRARSTSAPRRAARSAARADGRLLVGQIVEQTTAPYTWFPWVIVAWVVVVAGAAVWLGRVRPDQIRAAGQALGGEEGDIVMPAGAPRHART